MDELVVGTYEGFLLGYSIRTEDSTLKLKQTFATKSHTASVRCLSTGGKFLASGGTDDKVVVVDLKTRKEHTVLFNHSGPVNSVAFTHSGTHLLTGGNDGSIIVTRTGNWQIEKIWKHAHADQPVTAIAVHPSDKLAISIGDKSLKTWNLIKGRAAFTINLASKGIVKPTDIIFAPRGDRFALLSLDKVDVWTIKAGLEKRITCNSCPTVAQWLTDERLLIGLTNGNIIILTVSNSEALTYPAHKQRIKAMIYENELLYTASSSGELKVWSVEDTKLVEISSCNAACRMMCATLNRQNHLVKKEEHCEVAEEKEQSSDEKDNTDEEITMPPQRQPGAFVAVSYGNEREISEETHNIKVNKQKKNNRKRKQTRHLKKKDQAQEEIKKASSDENNDSDEAEDISPPKRKPGAFVTLSNRDEEHNEKEHKPKKNKRKRNKKPRIHNND